MKRSEINRIIKDSIEFIESFNFALPPFAHWTPEEWEKKDANFDEIRDNMLGWDVTDYGLGNFEKEGLVLFTLRNGNPDDQRRHKKTYAEKLLILQEEQVCTMHFHHHKMEDIINRGGGIMVMKLYNSTRKGELATSDVRISSDGEQLQLPAGTELELEPGQSVTLTPGVYHSFWAKKGHGPVLIGEVSQTNDDNTDNRFHEEMGRFPDIEEDEEPFRLLCNEYPGAQTLFF